MAVTFGGSATAQLAVGTAANLMTGDEARRIAANIYRIKPQSRCRQGCQLTGKHHAPTGRSCVIIGFLRGLRSILPNQQACSGKWALASLPPKPRWLFSLFLRFAANTESYVSHCGSSVGRNGGL
jgi:hypothetical protein